MTETETAHVQLVRDYLMSIQTGSTGNIERYFTPDALQTELPNRLNPNGGQSDLAAMIRRGEQGAKVLRGQTFEVRSAVARGDHVAVEAYWEGILAVPVGTLQAGNVMKAHFAMFFEFANGRISRQRNYDCFEPW
jgi:ketosteroid isomerase-like protein